MNPSEKAEGARAHPSLWLLVGAVFTAAAHMRWGIGLLAWVPLVRRLRGRRAAET